MDKLKKLKLNELMEIAKDLEYIPPSINIDTWPTEEIYYGAIYETLHSKYQKKASDIITSSFPPLKLLFKSNIRNYILIMYKRKTELSANNVNEGELSV
jgi:hypothetical protein